MDLEVVHKIIPVEQTDNIVNDLRQIIDTAQAKAYTLLICI